MRNNHYFLLITLFLCSVFLSCKGGTGTSGSSDPVGTPEVTDFEPKSGGVATKMLISGANFGTNPDKVRVWFNNKRAAVVGSSGDRMYALVPSKPGESNDIIDCKISIAVRDGKTLGQDSIVLDEEFKYQVAAMVSTVASKPNTAGDDQLIYDGTLAEVTYKWVNSVAVDKNNNVFVYQSWPVRFMMLNEEQNRSRLLYQAGWNEHSWQGFGEPNVDMNGELVIMGNRGNNWEGVGGYASTFYLFDPASQWSYTLRNMLHPTSQQQSAGMVDFPASMMRSTMCFDHNGDVWTMNYLSAAQLIKMSWLSRVAEVYDVLPAVFTSSEGGQTQVSMRFHPTEKNMLYICYRSLHCIYTYNIDTKEHTLWAGKQSVDGYRDGDKLVAEFNNPSGFCWNETGDMYVADSNNNVIRQISPEGMVSTLVGKPNVSGYVDGNPEDALFGAPSGIAIGPNGDIYIADNGNMCVRKLTIQ